MSNVITDIYGTTIVVNGDGTYTRGGIVISAVSDVAALLTFNAMAPAGWSSSQAPQNQAQTAAAALIAQGVTITSTSTPGLNGVYACDPIAQANIDSTMISILANGVFVNGGTTLAWLDLLGSPHVFPSVAEFKAFATAIGEIVAQVDEYAGGAVGSPPNMSATIP